MKVVILLSGGIDSTTLLYKLHAEGCECHPITIDYGQKHHKEVMAARNVCEQKSVELLRRWKYVRLEALRDLLPSALTRAEVVVPTGEYTLESQLVTVVPNRNMILLSIAAGYAQGIRARAVVYGAHYNDSVVYSDCRQEFVESMKQSVDLGTGSAVKLLAPFVNAFKFDIVKLGVTYRVPFSVTYSCYNGRDKHCGVCSTCHERKEAFRLADVADPTEYEK